jgi:hypothetical protein
MSRLGREGILDPGGSPGWTAGRLVAAVARAPALWVAGIVGLSALTRAAIGLRVPSPWILPDEVVYSDLAKNIAEGGRPAVRGVPVFGWGEVYPTLVAPAWAIFDDPFWAYHAALVTNALLMSIAAVPAYLLARLFLAQRASLLVAAMSVLVPSMAYTSVVMTENAAYPVFLFAVWLIARTVRRPTLGNQALAFVGLGVMAFTRIQGLALLGAYITAAVIYALVGDGAARVAYLRRFLPTWAVAAAATLAPFVLSVLRGDGALSWLGSRSETFNAFHAREVPEWLAYLAGDLLLYVAIVPALATGVVIGLGCRRRASEQLRLFSALGLSVFGAMLVSVSLVSASLDVDGHENLNERYLFYVVPLLFIGLAIWIREGLPRPRLATSVTLAVGLLLVVELPIARLRYNASFQSPALMPWLGVPVSSALLRVMVAAFFLVCGLLWLRSARHATGWLWLLVGVVMTLTFMSTSSGMTDSAASAAKVFQGRPATWVDDSIPPGSSVAVVWDERPAQGRTIEPFYQWIMVTEVFNTTVGDVYRLGPATYYEKFLPTKPVSLRADSVVVRKGMPLAAEFVLVTCRTPVRGTVIAAAPFGALRLVRVDEPMRLARKPSC